MYRRRLSQPFPSYPNLKTLVLENKNISEQCYRFTLMVRQVPTLRNIHNVTESVEVILRNNKFWGLLREKFAVVPKSLKDQSSSVLRVWAHQCECVFAQRLRRGQQMFSLYTKIWEERALREFIKQMRQRIGVRGREFLIGALGMTVYDWRSNRIPEDEIKKHSKELDYIYKLKEKTVCNKCSKNSSICPCKKRDDNIEKHLISSFDDWKVFVEKNDLIVWRRPHTSGGFEYKVYGSYADVSAEDFFNVQIDINYRRQWDKTAVVLNVVETDPDPTSHSDIVYWEMLWPALFANRDYVFNRRYLVDYKSKTLFVVSKSTRHPNCPKENTKYRIEDYYSYMVIKPYSDLNKPGIEFSLTYFDNPGVNIPASVTTWVAMKAMPDFLERLREASRTYKKYCFDSGVCKMCNILDSSDGNRLPYHWDYFDDEFVDNTIYEAHFKIKPPEAASDPPTKSPPTLGDAETTTGPANDNVPTEMNNFRMKSPAIVDGDADAETSTSPPNAKPEGRFWRYLHPYYYFS